LALAREKKFVVTPASLLAGTARTRSTRSRRRQSRRAEACPRTGL